MTSRALDDNAVHVWLASETLLDDPANAERFEAVMSDDERSRQRRFQVEPARRLHLIARGMQREVLSSYLPGTSASELRFVSGTSGRLALAPPFDASGLDFNLAHTPGLVALAVARGAPVGIDVERYDKKVPLEVARRFFSPIEADALDALPPQSRPRRFLRLWTLKEAYLKATGAGITGGLDSVTFRIDDGGACAFERAGDADALRWSFSQFDVGARHILAVARLPARESRSAVRIEWHRFGDEAAPDITGLLGQEQRPKS
jgi:4'-phosphopantetheinyl transferase